MKKYYILICLISASGCLGESFLVKEKPRKKASPNYLRQEIADQMGTLIEQLASSIELEAKIQQKLGKQLRELIDGQGKLQKSSTTELQKLLNELNHESQRRKQQQRIQEEYLKAL